MSSPNKQPVVEDIVSVFETTQNQSWSMFSEKLNNVSNKNSKKKDPDKSENTITLSSDDIPVFGLVPRLDKVMLVSCNECAMIVKRDCIHSHFYRRHNSSNVSHSEADKFSLVNFLCTVKTNKNKKLKITVRKPPEKKMYEREKIDTDVKGIKTEFDQEEYERLLKTNRAKIKQENTTEYVDQHDVEMVTTSCNSNTTSGVFGWDVKPCIKSLALDHCSDHKVNDKTIEHDKDSKILSTVSLGIKEDLQSNKYLDIQNIEHTVNYVTSSNELLKLNSIKKMKPKVTIDFSGIMNCDEEYYKKHCNYKNKYRKLPYRIKNIKEETTKKEYSDIINNTNYEDISTYNRSSNTSAVDVKMEYNKLFSGLQNDNEQTKLFESYKHLDVNSEIPSDSASSYHKSTEPLKIKEEFQIIPNNMYPEVKIKEEYDENNDKCKVEFYQSPIELTKCLSDNKYSEVIGNTYSGNFDGNISSIFPCSAVSVKEETTFVESSENILIKNECSDDTIISNNQSSIGLLDIKEESKYSLIADLINEESKPPLTIDYINEVSNPTLITVDTNEKSNPSSNSDFINEKSKHSLIIDYINDNSYTEYYQLYTNSIPQLSPSYKYLNNEDNFQSEENLNDQLNWQVENELNVALNLKVKENLNDELNLQNDNHFNDELNLQSVDNLSDELNLQVKGDLNNELNLHDDKDFNVEINFHGEEGLIDEIDLQAEDDISDDINWQSENDIDNELNFQDEDLNDELNLQGEDELSMELNYQDKADLSDELNLQNEDDLDDELHLQGVEDLNAELNLQSEDNFSDVENVSNVEDMSDEENSSSKENLGSDDVETSDNLKYNCVISSQLLNNEEETETIPSKECSVIINNDDSNIAFTGHDQPPTETSETLSNDEAKSVIDDTYVMIDNDGIVNNFENEYYQLSPDLYDHETQTSFTPSYKYSDVISNESSDSSDNSEESVSSYDQSSVESLYVSDKTINSSTNTSSDYTSDESMYDSESTTSSSTSSSDGSTILYDITKKPKYTQTNLLEDHEQFMDRIAKFAKSFGFIEGENNCTQNNDVPLECMNCYKATGDFINRHSNQFNENSVPVNSNVQTDECSVNNFTPISSSAQIINNTIIPMDVEEYEIKDSIDCDFNVSKKSHYLSHFRTHPYNPASQNNNLMHSSINENNCKIYNSEHNAYKPNEYILHGNTINESIPFINKNSEMYKELVKVVDKKGVNERKCKIMPFVKIAKNLKKNLKRQVADDKENRNHLISRGFKKFKMEFIDRDFSCSDESDNNDNADD